MIKPEMLRQTKQTKEEGMNRGETQSEILKKINETLAALQAAHSVDFNEKVSCIVCNLASAYQCLGEDGESNCEEA